MRSNDRAFLFDPNFNFATDNLMGAKNENDSYTPPVTGLFKLLDGTDFLLLDGTNFKLL